MQDLSYRVQEVLNPWSSSSGTAHVAPLLYNLVRTIRPRTVVEYGSGYTTPFLAQALKDNIGAFRRERSLLLSKSQTLLREFGSASSRAHPEAKKKIITDWMDSGGEAACLDPCFYVAPYRPQFTSFEALPEDDSYCVKLRALLDRLDLSELVTFAYDYLSPGKGGGFVDAPVIDLAWHDCDRHRELFLHLWPRLNPQGGMLIFHLGGRNYDGELAWFQAQRAAAGDLELVTLIEPHKLVQHGCLVLRKRVPARPAPDRQRADTEKFHEMLDALTRIAAEPGLST